ncbi:MAG: ABC transporter ATP-binding protein [Candidatus Undinarchaeales archaeon]|jgi:putative ABC transport system ATP-binding protein|nr:ABC transporter ATP-binding protein [Candidatus Undinarchaeales archaeon]MDP7492752.1 ABC transporter ATP-binding protein [Candidatus Undinarchaeales archaeon]
MAKDEKTSGDGGTTLLILKGVTKIYGEGDAAVHALRGIDLTIHQGEFVAIMGPSGSGKSTAMNMVGCLDVPTDGTILLEGQDIAELEESDLAQIRGQNIGFIFQQFNLIPGLTALENVMLPMVFQGYSSDERFERATELLEKMELGNRMDHLPSELSGGQQQRVAIARALCNDPDIILADEPTGNVDSKMGRDIMTMLSKLHKEGKTIIMVTHDDHLATYAKRTVYLLDGAVVDRLKYKENHALEAKKEKKKDTKKGEKS